MRSKEEWDRRFLDMAKLVASWSSCERAHCGAVIVRDKRQIATGYNGAPPYQKNCKEIGNCFRNVNNIKSGTQLENCRATGCHSEQNAIANAARVGNATLGATMYIYGNTEICRMCKGQIASAGIAFVVYEDRNGGIHYVKPSDDWTVHPVDIKA